MVVVKLSKSEVYAIKLATAKQLLRIPDSDRYGNKTFRK
jgi:hypothetical protein